MAPLGTFGAPDPDRRSRFRRAGPPDVRPIAVREALRRLRRHEDAPAAPRERAPRERDRLERPVRSRLRAP
jgi:hypothetical protein